MIFRNFYSLVPITDGSHVIYTNLTNAHEGENLTSSSFLTNLLHSMYFFVLHTSPLDTYEHCKLFIDTILMGSSHEEYEPFTQSPEHFALPCICAASDVEHQLRVTHV